MVGDCFDYQKYTNAMNAIAGAQSELETYIKSAEAEQAMCQKRIKENYKKQLAELEQICQDAMAQFSALSIQYCELCNRPAVAASAIPNTLPFREAIAKQVDDAKELQHSLSDIRQEQETLRRQKLEFERLQREQAQRKIEAQNRAEEERIKQELQRRQQILEDELRRTGGNKIKDYSRIRK